MRKKSIIAALAASALALAFILPVMAKGAVPAVKVAADEVIPESVSVEEETVTMKLGGEPVQLTVDIVPASATVFITWLADNPNVVAVDGNNCLHAYAEGTTVLHMTSETSGHTDTVVVTVLPADELVIEDLGLDKTTYAGTVGETFYLTPIVYPSGAESETYSWRCSDTRVAIVNSGTVMLIGEGTCVITVIDATGQFSATCAVTVNAAPVTETPSDGLNCGMLAASDLGMGALIVIGAAAFIGVFAKRRNQS